MKVYLQFILLIAAAALPVRADENSNIKDFLDSARSQIGKTVVYDGSYQRLDYPGGDIPIERGVCTDVIIRAYRSLGHDLQKLVYEDIRHNFEKYPSRRNWGHKKADRNIDHRRVANLRVFFERQGASLAGDFESNPLRPGDLLTWILPGNLPHIGIVSDRRTSDNARYLIIHNIGAGTREEDVIGRYELTGRYRYHPWESR